MRCFFLNDTATPEISTLSLPDPLPTCLREPEGARVQGLRPPLRRRWPVVGHPLQQGRLDHELTVLDELGHCLLLAQSRLQVDPLCPVDRKSTRLNSSHANISYAVFCLKKHKSRIR